MVLWTQTFQVHRFKFITPFTWLLEARCAIRDVQVVYEKQLESCHRATFWLEFIHLNIKDNWCISQSHRFFLYISKIGKDGHSPHSIECRRWEMFFISCICKIKLWTTLDPQLPLIVSMYSQKLESFSYATTFDAWIGTTNHYNILA